MKRSRYTSEVAYTSKGITYKSTKVTYTSNTDHVNTGHVNIKQRLRTHQKRSGTHQTQVTFASKEMRYTLNRLCTHEQRSRTHQRESRTHQTEVTYTIKDIRYTSTEFTYTSTEICIYTTVSTDFGSILHFSFF